MGDKNIDQTNKVVYSNGENTFTIECPGCYYKYTINDPEEYDVCECEDCGAPIVIEECSKDKIVYHAFVFEEEEWRE